MPKARRKNEEVFHDDNFDQLTLYPGDRVKFDFQGRFYTIIGEAGDYFLLRKRTSHGSKYVVTINRLDTRLDDLQGNHHWQKAAFHFSNFFKGDRENVADIMGEFTRWALNNPLSYAPLCCPPIGVVYKMVVRRALKMVDKREETYYNRDRNESLIFR